MPGVSGSSSANSVAADADVVVAIGTRLQDFTTGSWSVFKNSQMQLISINVGRGDATKHHAVRVVGDAKVALAALDQSIGDYRAPSAWLNHAADERRSWFSYLDTLVGQESAVPTYAQVIRAVNDFADDNDYRVAASVISNRSKAFVIRQRTLP